MEGTLLFKLLYDNNLYLAFVDMWKPANTEMPKSIFTGLQMTEVPSLTEIALESILLKFTADIQ